MFRSWNVFGPASRAVSVEGGLEGVLGCGMQSSQGSPTLDAFAGGHARDGLEVCWDSTWGLTSQFGGVSLCFFEGREAVVLRLTLVCWSTSSILDARWKVECHGKGLRQLGFEKMFRSPSGLVSLVK